MALQHRAQRHLQLLRAARMQLQQAQNQAGLGTVSQRLSQAPAQEADTSPSRQNGAAVQVQAVPSRQELQGTSTHVARQVYNEVANSRNRLSKRLSAANKVGAPAMRVPALLAPCPAHWRAGVRCLLSCQGAGHRGPCLHQHARLPFSPAPVCTALQECLTLWAAALIQCLACVLVQLRTCLAQRPWSPLVQQIRALERAADKRVDALSAAHSALQSVQSEFASLARQAEAAAASAQYSVDTDSAVERIQKLAQRMHLLQQVRVRQDTTYWVWCLCCPCSYCRHRTSWSRTALY